MLVDVANGSVGVALSGRGGGKPEIFYETRIALRPHGEAHKDAGQMVTEVTEALSRALSDTIKFGLLHLHFAGRKKKSVGEIVCALSAPWHISKASNIVLTHSESFTITESLIRDLVERAEEEFEAAILPDVPKAERARQATIIERKITAVRLNGYETPEPYGKHATDFHAEIILSAASRSFLDTVESAVHHRFIGDTAHSFHSFLLAAFFTLREMKGVPEDFLLVVVGSELTELLVVKQGEISEIISFPAGTEHLVAGARRSAIADTPQVAESFIKVWASGKAGPELAGQIEASAGDFGAEWIGYIRRAAGDANSDTGVFSKQVYLIAPEGFAVLFKKFLDRDRATLDDAPTSATKTVLIGKDFFASQYQAGDTKEIDPRLGLLGLFACR